MLQSIRSSSSSLSLNAPQEKPASADIETTATGGKRPTLQVLGKDLVLCREDEFFSYFRKCGVSPDDTILVLSAVGGYASGKSTLLNYLFFEKENVYECELREGISGLTIGMNVALIKFNYFGQKSESVWLLVIDSEGVASPTENSLDCGFLLSLRLLIISDAMIHNSSNSLQRSEFTPLNEASGRLFQNKKNRPDVSLIFFIQRASLFYKQSTDLLQFFPQQSLPKWFPNFDLSMSRDKIQGDKEGVRLELEDLKKKIVAALDKTPQTTVRSLWGQLKHLNDNLPAPKPNETIEESFTGCRVECAYCKCRCTRDRFWKHEHQNYTSECPSGRTHSHKCKQCVLAEEPVQAADADWTLMTTQVYNGPLWYCNNPRTNHGVLAHHFSWTFLPPFLHESQEFKNNILKHREHHFGPIDLSLKKDNALDIITVLPTMLGGGFVAFCVLKMLSIL